MNFFIENDKITFKRFYSLKSGYIADLKSDITTQYQRDKIFIIISDLREMSEENLNIIPGKLIVLDFIESLSSYKLNHIVLEEIIL